MQMLRSAGVIPTVFTVDACKVALTDAEVRVVWHNSTRTTLSTRITRTRIQFHCTKIYIATQR